MEELVILIELLPVSHLLLPHRLEIMSGHHFLLLEGHVLSPLLVDSDAKELLILFLLPLLGNTAIILLLAELSV